MDHAKIEEPICTSGEFDRQTKLTMETNGLEEDASIEKSLMEDLYKPMTPIKKYKGVTVLTGCDLDGIQTMDIRDDDIWLITFPRSGTTLTQEIIYLLKSNLDFEKARTVNMAMRFPFLDLCDPNFTSMYGLNAVEKQTSPRMIKTHLHRHLLPDRLFSSKCKKIYLRRNPKDVFVSCYMLTMFLRTRHPDFSINKYLELWLANEAYCSPWWQHIHDYMLLQHDPNILFLTYEQLVSDMPHTIRQIARHLDVPVTDTEVSKITDHCSFSKMSKNTSLNGNWSEDSRSVDWKFGGLIRKGKVGAWMDHLTTDMSDKIDAMVHEKLAHLKIDIDYGN